VTSCPLARFGLLPERFDMRPERFDMRPERFGLLPERFGMQLPGALRSLPSRLRKITAPQALQRLGRLLVQFLGAAVCCKLTRLRLSSALPCSRQPVRLVHCRCSHAGVGCPV
jgi:hypothetical protein